MADKKISALTSLSPVDDDDLIVVVDVSDTTMASSGTTKKAIKSELKGDKGDDGVDGASIIDAEFSGDDIRFIKDDNTDIILEDAKIELKGEKGDAGVGAEVVTSFGTPTSDEKVPSEKLTKDSLDTGLNTKADTTDSVRGILVNEGDMAVMTKNHGTPSNITIDSGAMVFNGTTGYVTTTTLTTVKGKSFSIWLNTDGFTSRMYISNRKTDNNKRFTLYSDSNNEIKLFTHGGTAIRLTSISDILPNTWYNVMLISKSDDTWDVYLNNVYKSSTATGAGSDFGNGKEVVIGRNGDRSENYFSGSANNIQIFDKNLSASERTAIYNAGKDADSPILNGLVAQYSGRSYEGTEATPTRINDTGRNIQVIPIGTNGQVLTVDNTEPGKVKWADLP